MPGTLTLSGMSAGLAAGQMAIGPVTVVGTNTLGEMLPLNLTTGDNTIAVPTGAKQVAIFWGTGSSVTVKVRTNLNSGDAGLPLLVTGFASWVLVTGTTSVILHASGVLTGAQIVFI